MAAVYDMRSPYRHERYLLLNYALALRKQGRRHLGEELRLRGQASREPDADALLGQADAEREQARELLIQFAYLISSILFILGLSGLSDPKRARAGMRLAMIAMLFAVIGTLLHHDIVRFEYIIVGLIVGSTIGVVIGLPLGIDIPMTAMPQFVAISHMFGAVAATLVGIDEYFALGTTPPAPIMAALGFEVILGALTVTGQDSTFKEEELNTTAGAVTITFDNKDSGIIHNLHVYQGTDATGPSVGQTDLEAGPVEQKLELNLTAGSYFYRCDAHPTTMKGTLTVS